MTKNKETNIEKMDDNPMYENFIVKFIPVVISIVFLSLFVLFFIMDKKEFSENENRNLAQFPDANVENIIEGEYMEEVSTYLCDHFPFRDNFINVKTQYEKLTGHNKSSRIQTNSQTGEKNVIDIYYGDDGFYIEPFVAPKSTDRIINILNKFSAKINNAEISLMLVPNAVTVYEDKLPSTAITQNQIEYINKYYENVNMSTIDVTTTLLENNDKDNLYFHLDHHWTTHAAYLAYVKYCEAKGITPLSKDEFKIETVTDEFKGTVYSKVNDYSAKPDSIDIYTQDNLALTVNYDTKDVTTNSLYELSYLKEKDKYSLFLNNINSLVTIENENATTKNELVIIKDSYANCFVPFIVNHYKKVYVFDTRYYRYPVSSFINENENVTDVLILYNMNTMDTDTGIKSIF